MSGDKPLVIVLLGPTASGKTRLAIELVEKIELTVELKIHNIDSRQIYKGMDIGTAKPTKDEQKRASHSLLDIREPDQPITVHEFKKEAEIKIKNTIVSKNIPFLVGGSGLYLKSIISGLKPPGVSPQKELREQLSLLGQDTCYQLLAKTDPQLSQKISAADSVRTQRALEVIYATGEKMSLQKVMKKPPWVILELGLDPKDLKEKIKQRTLNLYKYGLIEETEKLIQKFGEKLPMLQTIGYKEALEVLEGKNSIQQSIEITTRRTQQFAKRQRTWFRSQHDPIWLNDEEPLREAISIIKSRLG